MAAGLGGSYGQETQNSPNRQVDIQNLVQTQALNLHKQGQTAKQVLGTDDATWAGMHPGGMVPDKNDVAQRIRAYENYAITPQ
jgi:hypothetical protein